MLYSSRLVLAHFTQLDNDMMWYVCADNDDDGETAAGGRLAHLLQILVRPSPSPSPDSDANVVC